MEVLSTALLYCIFICRAITKSIEAVLYDPDFTPSARLNMAGVLQQ